MAYTKIPTTYVLYSENDKLAVSEENSFETYSEDKNNLTEIARQTFLIPSVNETSADDDLAELISDGELRRSFINKTIKAKLVLFINKTMKETQQVTVQQPDGTKEIQLQPVFSASTEPIDLTDKVGEKPQRERLTQDAKVMRLISGMSKEDQAAFLKALLSSVESEDES